MRRDPDSCAHTVLRPFRPRQITPAVLTVAVCPTLPGASVSPHRPEPPHQPIQRAASACSSWLAREVWRMRAAGGAGRVVDVAHVAGHAGFAGLGAVLGGLGDVAWLGGQQGQAVRNDDKTGGGRNKRSWRNKWFIRMAMITPSAGARAPGPLSAPASWYPRCRRRGRWRRWLHTAGQLARQITVRRASSRPLCLQRRRCAPCWPSVSHAAVHPLGVTCVLLRRFCATLAGCPPGAAGGRPALWLVLFDPANISRRQSTKRLERGGGAADFVMAADRQAASESPWPRDSSSMASAMRRSGWRCGAQSRVVSASMATKPTRW